MMFRTHILFAFFFYFLALKIFSFSWLFALLLALGAILPDIDSPSSFVNKKYMLGIGKSISFFSVHRGFWHSIYGATIFTFVSLVITFFAHASIFYALALFSGYILHLAADSLNVSGIKWFWKSGHLRWKIRTASLSEQIFFVALLVLTLYIAIGNEGFKKISAFVLRKP